VIWGLRPGSRSVRKGRAPLGTLAGIVVYAYGIVPGEAVLPGTTSSPDTRFIVLGTALVVVQAAMIGGLLLHWVRRRRAERALTAQEAALRGSYDEIRTLAGRLLRAQEDERTRIARELHDDVSQSIATICLQIVAID